MSNYERWISECKNSIIKTIEMLELLRDCESYNERTFAMEIIERECKSAAKSIRNAKYELD